MTIRFTKSWNGYYEGQIVTNPAGGNTEAQLIALGYAVSDLDGPDNSFPLAHLATDTSGNVTGLVGPGGTTVPLGRTYTGLVASRCNVPSSIGGAGNPQAMARSRHVAMDTITSLKVVFGNWYVNSSFAEVGSGATATVECSIEYPVGTYTRVTFSGSNAGSIASATNIVSDETAVSIPIGAAFFVRTYWLCSAGMPYTLGTNINNATGTSTVSGELFAYGSSVANAVMGGSINNAGVTTYFRPQAIIGRTKKVSWWLAGDSRLGQGATSNIDSASDVYGLVGELERILGKDYACLNAGRNGESLRNATTNYTLRSALSAYCSHVACEYGINDFDAGGRSAATVLADAVIFRALFSTKPFWQSTISPQSTGAWTLTDFSDQTPKASNTARVAYNALVRYGSAPFDGYFEVADAVESARDSGKWKAPGYTADGTHGIQLSMLALQAAAKIPTFNPC